MRWWSVFRKSLREQVRDPLVLALSLVFAPFFIFIYALFFPSGSTTYTVLVMNQDTGGQSAGGLPVNAGDAVIEAIRGMTYNDGSPLLKVRIVEDRAEAEALLRDRAAAAFLTIPEDFSRTIQAAYEGETSLSTAIAFGGDLTNPYYSVAAILATTAVDSYVQEAAARHSPVQYVEEPLGASAARSEFEIYVPGIFVFAVIMLVFQAAMTVAREVEAGTLRRLRLTRMTALDYLGGVTLSLMLFSAVSVVLTFLTALALGFRSQGPLGVAVLVGLVTSLSVIGMGLLVASLSKSVSQAFVIANFPLGLFMAFTNAMFPIPKMPLFTLGERVIGLFDILPPTHAVVALNKVFTLGQGIEDVLYELVVLLVLSVGYFAAGVWAFQRTQMKTA
ncbi:MAG: ABC transporter permease [Anaerolineae bacterium]|nr:ABC transporter permease [Anaerolineae bacterium]